MNIDSYDLHRLHDIYAEMLLSDMSVKTAEDMLYTTIRTDIDCISFDELQQEIKNFYGQDVWNEMLYKVLEYKD